MSIDNVKFEEAVSSIENKRKIGINRAVARIVIRKAIAVRDTQNVFSVETVRLALNDADVRDRDDRKLYSAVIGSYFGRKSWPARNARARRGQPSPRQEPPSKPVGVRTERGSRQLRWRI